MQSTTREEQDSVQIKAALDKKLPLMEMFGPTIQGEGAVIGAVSYFIRLGGCTYRCSWCDSMHAVDPKEIHARAEWLTQAEIADRLLAMHREKSYGFWETQIAQQEPFVTISGGDPLMWDLYDMVSLLGENFRVAVETQGAFYKPWVRLCDVVTVSPKPPSSKMDGRLDYNVLSKYLDLGKQLSFKVVCFGNEDIQFARDLHQKYPQVPMYLSCGTDRPPGNAKIGIVGVQQAIFWKMDWLTKAVFELPDLWDCRVLPQLHALMWGHKQGV